MADSKVFGVGQIAKYCHVDRTTILRWIKEGKMAAYSLPSGYYRVKSEDLLAFLRKYKMPIPSDLRGDEAVKVLVVDDEDMMREVMVESLQSYQPVLFEVEAASGGVEACIKIGRFRPDVILLDVMMPGMDGVDVCRELKSSPQTTETKVIVVTGYMNHEKVAKIREAGVDSVLAKPVAPEALMEEILRVLGKTAEAYSN
ncbi:MAG: response regulator [Planctomycetota bacterium]